MGPLLKVAVCLATIVAWGAFIFLDSQWNACLSHAVEEGKKTYGEIYGPLTFFRPATMYLALGLSVLSGAWLALGAKERSR